MAAALHDVGLVSGGAVLAGRFADRASSLRELCSLDHSVRVPFVEAAARNGVPPLNPFYGLGKVPVLRYFYYWYVVCALPMRLFGLSARGCLNASVFWSGLGLASTVPLFLKYFLGETEHLRRKSIIGIALLTVTGLDLIPVAVNAFQLSCSCSQTWNGGIRIRSHPGWVRCCGCHIMWQSLTACMAGLLVFSTIDEDNPLGQRIWAAVISGLAFASAAGLSVYVTFPSRFLRFAGRCGCFRRRD